MNIQVDGRLWRGSRVAIHSQENLEKIGRMDKVIPVDLLKLYGDETRKIQQAPKRNLKRVAALYVLTTLFVCLAISGLYRLQSDLEDYFLARIAHEAIAMYLDEREGGQRESQQEKRVGGEVDKTFQKKVEKMRDRLGLTDEKVWELQGRY